VKEEELLRKKKNSCERRRTLGKEPYSVKFSLTRGKRKGKDLVKEEKFKENLKE